MAKQPRAMVCASCLGEVRVPKGSRKHSIEQMMDNHRPTCPGGSIPRRNTS